eukprot:14307-Heterococcus_DN1.PRE.1
MCTANAVWQYCAALGLYAHYSAVLKHVHRMYTIYAHACSSKTNLKHNTYMWVDVVCQHHERSLFERAICAVHSHTVKSLSSSTDTPCTGG